jgi:hypothetical protein
VDFIATALPYTSPMVPKKIEEIGFTIIASEIKPKIFDSANESDGKNSCER